MKMKMQCLLETLIIIVVVACSSSSFVYSHAYPRLNNATDQHSLLQFKAAITADPLHSLANWNPNISFCGWTGVSCSSRRERVVALNLSGMALKGSISPSLANLSFLHSLALVNNSLHGHIPPQLGSLVRLAVLKLDTNSLEGHIPASLCACRNLVELSLSFNSLSGSIPTEVGRLRRLKMLYLGGNKLTGVIPSSLGNLSALTEMDLARNNLEGAIPQKFGMLTNLSAIFLFENQLTGHIPSSLSNISTLTEIIFFENDLTGVIPEEFGSNLLKLEFLSLWGNQLSGNIPTSLANASKLTILALRDNRLSGPVPIELGKLNHLERLFLDHNQLVSDDISPFLTALTNCSALEEIVLRHNHLSGKLPLSIGLLSPKLSFFSLSNNNIGGYIPGQIGNLTNLIYLDLSHNSFREGIPRTFGRLKMLERLYLDANLLEGSVPDEIGQMERLGLLSISHNWLSDELPDSLGQLQQLRRLHLHHNQLSGKIPAALGNCQTLELLDLSHNKLSGSIPPEVAGLQNLAFYMNLSGNLLQGSLPPELGKIVMAQAIDISENRLTGRIPSTLGGCIALEYLDVSRNEFEGGIPSALGQLQNLEDMDLSWNHLSGTVPNSLQNLKMLGRADFSFNSLTGEVPGFFSSNHNITILFEGNSGLCGPTRYSLPPCPKQRHVSLLQRAKVEIVFISVFTVFCILVAGFLWGWYSHRKSLDISINGASELEMLSYDDLATATNGFDQATLLGAGSFGSVYKGVLRDGTVVAIKVLDLQHEEVSKSFNIECEILQRVEHSNLVKIITSCSNLHFKGLVLQFVPNGSLENHLHSDRDNNDTTDENCSQDVCHLKLSKRLDIAIDIAYGLAYLHHECFVQVVHRDLKPSNVLLDGNMRALVADFGIAKLIDANCIQPFTSPAVGSFGYIAPEYGLVGRVSTKGDVYSFGILLLDMVTRKRPTDDMFVNGLTLQEWVSRAFPNGITEVVDGSLLTCPNNDGLKEGDMSDCLTQFIHVALLCTKESPRERPTIRDAVRKLEKIRDRYGEIIMDSLPPLERLALQLRPEVVSFELDNSSSLSSF